MINLVSIGKPGESGLPGPPGPQGIQGINGIDGKNIELQVNFTHVQWRLVGDSNWNLSTANLQKAEGYLMHEWNMNNLLSVDHPFKLRRPLVTD